MQIFLYGVVKLSPQVDNYFEKETHVTVNLRKMKKYIHFLLNKIKNAINHLCGVYIFVLIYVGLISAFFLLYILCFELEGTPNYINNKISDY